MSRKFLAPALLPFLSPFAMAAGDFTTTAITGDADSGISADKAYTVAVDVFGTGNVRINDAVFTGSGGGGNPGTNAYATSGLNNGFTGFANPVSGNTGAMISNFLYNGNPATYTLNNLRVGETYTTTFFNAAFGGPGGRIHNVTTSDGGVLNNYDQNGQPGSTLKYTFTAASNSLTFSMTPAVPADTWHHYAFSNEVVKQKALLTDNFYAPVNPDTNNLNFNLAARQGGLLTAGGATIPWVGSGNTQVGNATGGIDGGNYLLSAFGATSALDKNFNGSSSAGGISVSFDLAPNSVANGDATVWESINIGQSSADKNGVVNGGHSHFGILFRGNGLLQAFDGNVVLTPGEPLWSAGAQTNGLTRIELLATDPTDGNPFDGIGQTDISVFSGGVLAYSFSKTGGGYADNYLNFSAAHIGGVDNLMVAQMVPEPTGAALLALSGSLLLRRRRRA
ncbi:MAG: motif protein [Verrucomicrobiales bacterium]|nr:motif protein [Verrucomicrobiales bacterium]